MMELPQLVEKFGLPIGLSVALVAALIALVWYLLRKVDRMGEALNRQSTAMQLLLTETVSANTKVVAQNSVHLSEWKDAHVTTHRLLRELARRGPECARASLPERE